MHHDRDPFIDELIERGRAGHGAGEQESDPFIDALVRRGQRQQQFAGVAGDLPPAAQSSTALAPPRHRPLVSWDAEAETIRTRGGEAAYRDPVTGALETAPGAPVREVTLGEALGGPAPPAAAPAMGRAAPLPDEPVAAIIRAELARQERERQGVPAEPRAAARAATDLSGVRSRPPSLLEIEHDPSLADEARGMLGDPPARTIGPALPPGLRLDITDPDFIDYGRTMTGAFLRGAGETAGSAISGAGEYTGADFLRGWGRGLREAWGEKFDPHPALQSTLAEQVPHGLGSVAAFMGTGSTGGAAGLGVLSGAGMAAEEARRLGGDPLRAAGLGGLVGATEAFAPSRLFARMGGADKLLPGIQRAVGKLVARHPQAGRIAGQALSGTLEEGAQEAFAETLYNWIASLDDPDRELLEGVARAGEIGGIVGLIANTAVAALPGRLSGRLRRPATEPGEVLMPPGGEPLTEIAAAAEPAAGAEPAAAPAPERVPEPVSAVVPVGEIDVEPERFQFKRVTGAGGVSGSLAGVEVYDPDIAGPVDVWVDPADGRMKLIDGHNRLARAQELGVTEHEVRVVEAEGAEEARLKAAVKNVASSHGSPTDAAKLIRDEGFAAADLKALGVNLTTGIARLGHQLAQLPREIFQEVATGALPERRGAAIGGSGLSEAGQRALYGLVRERESRGRALRNDEITELARFVEGAGETTTRQETLFGEEELTRSNAVEKAELSAHVKNRLSGDRRLFGFLTRGGRAGRIEEAGVGEVDVSRAERIAGEAASVEQLYDQLSIEVGPVSAALNEGAQRLAAGENANDVREQTYERITRVIQEGSPGRAQVAARGDGGRADTPDGVPAGPAVAGGTAAGRPQAPVGGGATAAGPETVAGEPGRRLRGPAGRVTPGRLAGREVMARLMREESGRPGRLEGREVTERRMREESGRPRRLDGPEAARPVEPPGEPPGRPPREPPGDVPREPARIGVPGRIGPVWQREIEEAAPDDLPDTSGMTREQRDAWEGRRIEAVRETGLAEAVSEAVGLDPENGFRLDMTVLGGEADAVAGGAYVGGVEVNAPLVAPSDAADWQMDFAAAAFGEVLNQDSMVWQRSREVSQETIDMLRDLKSDALARARAADPSLPTVGGVSIITDQPVSIAEYRDLTDHLNEWYAEDPDNRPRFNGNWVRNTVTFGNFLYTDRFSQREFMDHLTDALDGYDPWRRAAADGTLTFEETWLDGNYIPRSNYAETRRITGRVGQERPADRDGEHQGVPAGQPGVPDPADDLSGIGPAIERAREAVRRVDRAVRDDRADLDDDGEAGPGATGPADPSDIPPDAPDPASPGAQFTPPGRDPEFDEQFLLEGRSELTGDPAWNQPETDPPEVSSAPAVHTGGPVSAPQVIGSYARILEAAGKPLPIRTGRIAQRRAAGVYKVKPHVARIRRANDIGTAAHEAGHALERTLYGWPKGGPWKSPLASGRMQRELAGLGRDLYGGTTPAAGYKREGWAEFFRLWMEDERAARRKAPGVTRWFEEAFVAGRPEVKAAITEAQALGTRYREQGAVMRGVGGLAEREGFMERVGGAQGLRDAIWTHLAEGLQPLYRVSEQAEQALGRKLRPGEDPFQVASAFRLGHHGLVRHWIERGQRNWQGQTVGPPLREAGALIRRAPIPKAYSDLARDELFGVYLWARRARALLTDPKGPRDPGMSFEDANAVIEELGSPRFDRAASVVYQWQDGVLDYMAAASPVLSEMVKAIRVRDPGDYVPLSREFSALEKEWGRSGRGTAGKIRRLAGSGRRVFNPFESVVGRASGLIGQAYQQVVMDLLVRLAQLPDMGGLIEEIPVEQTLALQQSLGRVLGPVQQAAAGAARRLGPGDNLSEDLETLVESIGDVLQWQGDALGDLVAFFAPKKHPDTGDPVVSYWDAAAGRMRWYYVRPDIYRTLEGMDIYRLPKVLDVMFGVPRRTFRAGTTGLRASFAFWNWLKDSQAYMVQSRLYGRPDRLLFNYFAAMKEVLLYQMGSESQEFANLYHALGVDMAAPLSEDIPQTRRAVRKLTGTRTGRFVQAARRKSIAGMAVEVVESWRDFWDLFRDLIQLSEKIPRVAEMKNVLEQMGWEPGDPLTLDQIVESSLSGDQVTTDFSATGSWGRVLNQLMPFLNAGIQGPRALGRAAKRNPQAVALRLAILSIQSMALFWAYKDEEWYQELTYRERWGSWWLPVTMPDGEETLVQIPRAFEIGTLTAMPQMLLEAWYEKEPELAAAWMKHTFETVSPFSPKPWEAALELTVPTSIIGEQLANERFFFDSPIVPRRERDVPAREQFGPYTSRAAVLIGDVLNLSPRRVEHAVEGLFGGLARDVEPLTDALARMAGAPGGAMEREPEAADLPVVGRLFRRGGRLGTHARTLDDFYETLEQAQRRQRSEETPETEDESERRLLLNDAGRALGALAFIELHTPGREERVSLNQLQLQIARDALDDYRSDADPLELRQRHRVRAVYAEQKKALKEIELQGGVDEQRVAGGAGGR